MTQGKESHLFVKFSTNSDYEDIVVYSESDTEKLIQGMFPEYKRWTKVVGGK